MKNDAGNLSIDFLAGFTVFLLAFIWVASMIPNLFIGITGYTIDYDAVAYRTGVILVEDPGMPVNPPWESKTDAQKGEVQRLGLSISKETPNLLTPTKINRFFCLTMFSYPDDYQEKAIFGDHPYLFNISVRTFDNSINQSVGGIRPAGYGYIRRFVSVKQMSNATINATMHESAERTSNHTFSVIFDMNYLVTHEKRPEYQIDPLTEPITVNITGLKKNLSDPAATRVNLVQVRLWRVNPGLPMAPVPPDQNVTIDGNPQSVKPPVVVRDNVSIIFPASFFGTLATDQSKMFVNFSFVLDDGTGLVKSDFFINDTYGNKPFEYNYFPENVTQPRLEPGVVEVAVW